MKIRNLVGILLIIIMAGCTSGCTFNADNLSKQNLKLNERSRELTQDAYYTEIAQKAVLYHTQYLLSLAQVTNNQATLAQTNYIDATNSISNVLEANDLATSFLSRNQAIQGIPVQDQKTAVDNLLSTNKSLKLSQGQVQNTKEEQEQAWRVKQQQYENKLTEMGAVAEQERNSRIAFWTKWGIIAGLVILVPILLCVFFPPFLSLIIGFVPKIIGLFKVVPVAVVHDLAKGVDGIKTELNTQVVANQTAATPKSYTPQEVLDLISTQLKMNVNDSSDAVISHIRGKLNLL